MIFDFVEIKQELDLHINLYLKKVIAENSPTVAKFAKKRLYFEGKEVDSQSIDGFKKLTKFVDLGESFSFSKDELKNLKIADVLEKMSQVGKSIAEKQERYFLKTLDGVVETTGNIINNEDNTSPDAILKSLEMVDIQFKEGEPVRPIIMGGPRTIEKIRENIEKMTQEEKQSFESKFDKILRKKHEEYISRENNRKLVD